MRFLLADDHELVLDAISGLIAAEFPDAEIETVTTGTALRDKLADSQYDLILLDLRMPGQAGSSDVKLLIEAHPDQRIAILSGYAGKSDVHMLMQAGAGGYIPKTMPGDGLAAALRLILSGEQYVPSSFFMDSGNDDELKLTPREREVLACLQLGDSNKAIARKLDIQETTVKLHLRSLAVKLEARNRTEVVVKAIQMDLLV